MPLKMDIWLPDTTKDVMLKKDNGSNVQNTALITNNSLSIEEQLFINNNSQPIKAQHFNFTRMVSF